jgi:hypothetical protein
MAKDKNDSYYDWSNVQYITNSMEQSIAQDASNCASNLEFLSNLLKQNIHYHFHKSPPLVSTVH